MASWLSAYAVPPAPEQPPEAIENFTVVSGPLVQRPIFDADLPAGYTDTYKNADTGDEWVITYKAGGVGDRIEIIRRTLSASDIIEEEYEQTGVPLIPDGTHLFETWIEHGDLAGTVASTTHTIAATGVNPFMLSESAVSVSEDTTLCVDLEASRPSTFAIGGADAALFEVQGGDELHFIDPPDFEDPQDAGANNVYNVTITPTAIDDSDVGDAQAVAITVLNEPEATLTYIGSNAQEGSSTHSFSLDIGAAAADRYIVVGITRHSWGAAPTVTAAGTSLTNLLWQGDEGEGANSKTVGFFGGLVASGSGSQTIEITHNGGSGHLKAAFVWKLTGLNSTTPQGTDYVINTSGGATFDVAVMRADHMLAVGLNANAGAFTFDAGTTPLNDRPVTGYTSMKGGDLLMEDDDLAFVIDPESNSSPMSIAIVKFQ